MTAARTRREPPRFRRVVVRRVEYRSPRLLRVTLGGPELGGFTVEQPAASVRLLLPSSASGQLAFPAWNGNEFLLADGRRPVIRTFTPRRLDRDALELDLEVVTHDGRGAAAEWAKAVEPGAPAAISGPGRGYVVDRDAPAFFLAGDETAIPAISQLLETLPAEIPTHVRIEVAHPDARLALPGTRAAVEWRDLPSGAAPGDALVAAVRDADLAVGTRVWVAGEAAAVQRIRRHLFDERGLPRAETWVRGYWQRGRRGDTEHT